MGWRIRVVATVWPGDTVPAVDTFADEVWTCTVTPNDGEEDGPTATASVTVGSSTARTMDRHGDFAGRPTSSLRKRPMMWRGRRWPMRGMWMRDGLDDLLIGAIGNSDGGYYAGKAYLFLGANPDRYSQSGPVGGRLCVHRRRGQSLGKVFRVECRRCGWGWPGRRLNWRPLQR